MESEEIWVAPTNFISTLCRICVTANNVDCSIYDTTESDDNGSSNLHTMMKSMFPAVFNDEQTDSDQRMNWPSKICQNCTHLITVAYGLYELCVQSADRLRKLLAEEQDANATDGDGMLVEADYLSELVKTEYIESEYDTEQPPKQAAANRGKGSKKHKSVSNRNSKSKQQKKSSKIILTVEAVFDTEEEAAKANHPPDNDDTFDAIEAKYTGVEALDDEEHSLNEESPSPKTLNNKRCREPRRMEEPTKNPSKKKALGSTDHGPEQTDEPQSKIDLYRCQLCDGPTYTSPTVLTKHLKSVHRDQIRYCELCPKVFMNEPSFQHHQYCHATGRSHFCTFCDKGFQTSDLLTSHIRIHTHRADFLCSLCGKEFNNKSNLRQHVKRHTGDKPWACNQCPGRFTTKGGLTSHQHTHTTVKAFSCDTCGSQFNKHYSLIKHQLIHTGARPYSCEVCAMRFTSTYHVKRHMRTHTGEKPFKCTYCERSFAQSNDMVKHMRTHVGDNPYQCDRCDASYRLLSELRNHYQAHYQPGEKVPGCSSATEDEQGIRFTSTDILKLRYRKEMAQSGADVRVKTEGRKVTTEATEYPDVP